MWYVTKFIRYNVYGKSTLRSRYEKESNYNKYAELPPYNWRGEFVDNMESGVVKFTSGWQPVYGGNILYPAVFIGLNKQFLMYASEDGYINVKKLCECMVKTYADALYNLSNPSEELITLHKILWEV